MKFLKRTLFLSLIIASNIIAINPELMNVFKDSWKANIKLFEKDYYSYHDAQHRGELQDFVKSYEDLAHAVKFLEITTMPIAWQNALTEANKYLNTTAKYYFLVSQVLRDPGIIHGYEFQNPHCTIELVPCMYMNLNIVKKHISTINAYLKFNLS
ncbi:hypothetical protein Noda2021_09900 [Candidatus Dependentiae bacterium Noda2021]|nr:hypothetical protein Noda2021_09900 [Candidatus Dependentiae bacterium Noda2021]